MQAHNSLEYGFGNTNAKEPQYVLVDPAMLGISKQKGCAQNGMLVLAILDYEISPKTPPFGVKRTWALVWILLRIRNAIRYPGRSVMAGGEAVS
jgi:hypothetical protein